MKKSCKRRVARWNATDLPSRCRKRLIEAARYYESRVAALGAQFLSEANRAVAIILQAPERWRIIEGGVRSYLMPRFPYAVYYRDFPDRLHILAFKHHRQHPDYWRYRVSE